MKLHFAGPEMIPCRCWFCALRRIAWRETLAIHAKVSDERDYELMRLLTGARGGDGPMPRAAMHTWLRLLMDGPLYS